MKNKIISFIWQHILLLVSLYVMTLGVAVCVRSQLGSSVISTIPYVMSCAGEFIEAVPSWTIGTYTIIMNAVFVMAQIAGCTILGIGIAMVYVGMVVRTMNKHLGWFDHLLAYKPGFRRYVYGLAKHVKHLYGQE